MVASLFVEAARGAQLEVLRQATVWERISVATTLAITFAKELVGIFGNAPYGFHAMAMYRSVFYASKRGLEGPRSSSGSGSGEMDAAGGEIARGEAGDAESPSAARRSAIGIRKMRRQLTSTVWNWASSMEAMLWQGLPHGGVRVVYDIRYGPRPRNTLDIYMPPDLPLDSNAAESSSSSSSTGAIATGSSATSSSSGSCSEGSKGRPVLFFVHGGVWASGEKWMYSPLAIRFAQSGAVVVTIQYTLYPEALAIDQVQETSKALSWAMDHVHEYGGDPSRIFLAGHSSGAHVCSMVVWRRLSPPPEARAETGRVRSLSHVASYRRPGTVRLILACPAV
ncbi:unnamed protein product [Closterium sp. Yama58-4]|nr:unnamed protein product [Closterium sp. Yama58-4]